MVMGVDGTSNLLPGILRYINLGAVGKTISNFQEQQAVLTSVSEKISLATGLDSSFKQHLIDLITTNSEIAEAMRTAVTNTDFKTALAHVASLFEDSADRAQIQEWARTLVDEKFDRQASVPEKIIRNDLGRGFEGLNVGQDLIHQQLGHLVRVEHDPMGEATKIVQRRLIGNGIESLVFNAGRETELRFSPGHGIQLKVQNVLADKLQAFLRGESNLTIRTDDPDFISWHASTPQIRDVLGAMFDGGRLEFEHLPVSEEIELMLRGGTRQRRVPAIWTHNRPKQKFKLEIGLGRPTQLVIEIKEGKCSIQHVLRRMDQQTYTEADLPLLMIWREVLESGGNFGVTLVPGNPLSSELDLTLEGLAFDETKRTHQLVQVRFIILMLEAARLLTADNVIDQGFPALADPCTDWSVLEEMFEAVKLNHASKSGTIPLRLGMALEAVHQPGMLAMEVVRAHGSLVAEVRAVRFAMMSNEVMFGQRIFLDGPVLEFYVNGRMLEADNFVQAKVLAQTDDIQVFLFSEHARVEFFRVDSMQDIERTSNWQSI